MGEDKIKYVYLSMYSMDRYVFVENNYSFGCGGEGIGWNDLTDC